MSWDVSILKFSQPFAAVEDIPDDETPLPLGPRQHVHSAVNGLSCGACPLASQNVQPSDSHTNHFTVLNFVDVLLSRGFAKV